MATKRPTKSKTTRSRAELKEQFDEVRTGVDNQEEVDSVTAAAVSRQRAAALAHSADTTISKVIALVTNTGVGIQSALDTVKNSLVASVQELEILKDAKQALEDEIAELHGKEIVSSELKAMLAEYDTKKNVLEQEIAVRQADFDKKLAEQKALEAQRKAEVETARKRDEEQYSYDTRIRRRDEEATFKAQLQTDRLDFERESNETLLKLEERAEKLTAAEQELADLRALKASLQATIDKAVSQAVHAATGSMDRDHKHAIALMEANAKAEKGLLEQTITSLRQKVTDQAAIITALESKLDRSDARVETISKAALDSASGRQALAASHETLATVGQNGGSPRKS